MSSTEGRRESIKKDVRFSVTEEEREMINEKRKRKEGRVSISTEDQMEKDPHSLFVQMNVLNEDGTTWKEQARWLVYEEKLEDSDRWSKPHMPTTSFVALEEVRNSFEKGTLALHLDTDCGCLRKIMDDFSVVIAQHEKLDEETRKKLLDVLRKPHIRGYDMANQQKGNVSLQKKMAKDTEAANILVGKVDFIDEPILAFARLAEAEDLSAITEVNLPTKFVFLVLAPKHTDAPPNYFLDIGRSMAQLLTDKIFPQVVYKAKKRQHLLEGIDEFKSQLTVLPPSIWDPNTRLDPVDEKIQMDQVKKRLEKRRWSVSLSIERQQSQDLGEQGDQDSNLQRTGRLFGGLIADIKRRYNRKTMLSDYRDGVHLQSVASIIFLYFACITPIITFGGLLGAATDNYMGTMETIMSGALCGIIYALFAGQPLTIVGATGPLLVFETLLYSFCKDHGLNFLAFRFWIGFWVLIYLLVVVALDLSALIRYITRFTEECFATLVSVIFIYSAFKKLSTIWRTHPIHSHAIDESVDYKCHCEHPPAANETIVNGTSIASIMLNASYHTSDHAIFHEHDWKQLVYEDCITYQHRIIVDAKCITEANCLEHGWELVGPACNVYTVTHSVPDVFLLSVILCMGTYLVAAFFRDLRHTNYLTYTIRNTLSDFAIFFGIVICTCVDVILAVDTPKLTVPDKIKNTRSDRGWFVNPMDVDEWWHPLVAAFPSLLAAILIFLDQQITSVIVNRKEHKLKKGHGYHLDLFVIGFLVFITSALGTPWFVAATVAAITHVQTLRRVSEVTAPGEKPVFIGAREQRVTGLITHMLIGVSVFLTGILKHIPMAVLYGVFLYMGVNSLHGMQFVERMLLLFSPKKYQADLPYLRRVTMKKVNLFTLAQIICFIVLWVFKSVKAIAMLFPLMILGPAVVRLLLEKCYTQEELHWLDEVLPIRRRRNSHKDVDDMSDEDVLIENGSIRNEDEPKKQNGLLRSIFRKKEKEGELFVNPVELKPLNDEPNDSNRNSISSDKNSNLDLSSNRNSIS